MSLSIPLTKCTQFFVVIDGALRHQSVVNKQTHYQVLQKFSLTGSDVIDKVAENFRINLFFNKLLLFYFSNIKLIKNKSMFMKFKLNLN